MGRDPALPYPDWGRDAIIATYVKGVILRGEPARLLLTPRNASRESTSEPHGLVFSDVRIPKGIHRKPDADHPWWRVMCLTGVDYFSTLGYQPGIAFLAAGLLSPIATLILVLVTLFGALAGLRRVAEASPNGQGSIGMLEKLFPKWSGKTFVLILLGFATTDFIITMTLSAADAAAHFLQNPFTPDVLKSQMAVTLVLLTVLAAIFLKGFKEAIGVAVILVGAYLALNVVVTAVGIREVMRHPEMIRTGSMLSSRSTAILSRCSESRWYSSRSSPSGCQASKPVLR